MHTLHQESLHTIGVAELTDPVDTSNIVSNLQHGL